MQRKRPIRANPRRANPRPIPPPLYIEPEEDDEDEDYEEDYDETLDIEEEGAEDVDPYLDPDPLFSRSLLDRFIRDQNS